MRYTLFIFFILAVFSSCEKVIDLDLNEAEKKYVIEGVVTDKAGTAKVLISQTKGFDEDNSFPGVSGAAVTITERTGAVSVVIALAETAPGVYEAPALIGASGREYSLSVTISGQAFTAICIMPEKQDLDTIYVTDEILFAESRKIVNAVYDDPPGLGNSWRFVQYVNGRKEDQIMIRNDEYSDNRRIINKLFFFSDEEDNDADEIKSGDEIIVDMQCIDPAIYKYWWSLFRSSTGLSGQATPTNPVTNLQGGALGYFSAHTLQTNNHTPEDMAALEKCILFLNSIGIETVVRKIDTESFLPGLLIEKGSLSIDMDILKYPGDILHEAGHIAITPAKLRPVLNGKIIAKSKDRASEEMMAIAWSYAACIHLSLDPYFVFHDSGYHGGSDYIIDNVRQKTYFGLPMLQSIGLTADDKNDENPAISSYPHMIKWLRD
jgi:hypothetical protein